MIAEVKLKDLQAAMSRFPDDATVSIDPASMWRDSYSILVNNEEVYNSELGILPPAPEFAYELSYDKESWWIDRVFKSRTTKDMEIGETEPWAPVGFVSFARIRRIS